MTPISRYKNPLPRPSRPPLSRLPMLQTHRRWHTSSTMFSDLPTDLIDRILTILPDFQSLSSAIRTSNSVIYSVFQSHPKSIVRSVAHNVAGPAFPQALRFLHFSSLVDTTGSSSDALDKLPDEYHILETPITRTLAHQLEEHARMIFSLENLFSLRYCLTIHLCLALHPDLTFNTRFKDRTSSLSRLTDSESVCFHRAMYRFWICAMLEQQTVDGSDTGCFQFLEPYSSSELFEIKRIMLFLKDVVGFVGISSNSWICKPPFLFIIMTTAANCLCQSSARRSRLLHICWPRYDMGGL